MNPWFDDLISHLHDAKKAKKVVTDKTDKTQDGDRTAELSSSHDRLKAADIRVAIWITEMDAGMIITGEQIVQGEHAARQAWQEGAVVFDADEMFAYIPLSPAERRLFLSLKRIGESRGRD